jgi:hypothetical protein
MPVTTYHQALLQAAAYTQQALVAVATERVFIEREAPIERDECPAVNVSLGPARNEGTLGSEGQYDLLRLSVQLQVSVHTRGVPHTLMADPILGEAHTALMSDPTLGGLALRLAFKGSTPRAAVADGNVAGIVDLNYEATVVVSERTLAIQAI